MRAEHLSDIARFSDAVFSRVAELDARAATRQDVIRRVAHGLNFPDYWRANWNSFDECVADLDWLGDESAAIVHRSLPAISREELSTYLKILSGAVEETQGKLQCFFTAPDLEAIRTL